MTMNGQGRAVSERDLTSEGELPLTHRFGYQPKGNVGGFAKSEATKFPNSLTAVSSLSDLNMPKGSWPGNLAHIFFLINLKVSINPGSRVNNNAHKPRQGPLSSASSLEGNDNEKSIYLFFKKHVTYLPLLCN